MDIKNFTIGDLVTVLTVIAAFYAFYKMVKELRKPREEKEKKINDELALHKKTLDKHEEILDEHTIKLDKIDSTVTTISDNIKESSEYAKEADELIKTALCAMQRQSLLNECEKCLKRGFATLEQKETISGQYESYHSLGGNSFITNIFEQVMALPVSEAGEH